MSEKRKYPRRKKKRFRLTTPYRDTRTGTAATKIKGSIEIRVYKFEIIPFSGLFLLL